MNGQRCGSCRFGKPVIPDNALAARCRRFPPVLIGDKHASSWSHPFVKLDDWCGEWKQALPEQPKPARERSTD